MYYHFKNTLVGIALFLFSGLAADSATIYNNGSPNQVDGQDISDFVVADSFSLSTPVTISGATFWASADLDPFLSQFSGSVGWGILSDAEGSPGTLLASGTDNAPTLIDTGVQILGTEEYKITLNTPLIAISNGTYWLALHESGFGSPNDGTPIYWDTTSSQNTVALATSDLTGTSGWFSGGTGSSLAFTLSGSLSDGSQAPEPQMAPVVSLLLALSISWRVLQAKIKAFGSTRKPT